MPSNAVFCRSGGQGYNRLISPVKCWDIPEIPMGESLTDIPPLEGPPEKRLDSWKEIAAYLNRDVTTVQRWEKREGMPVHRHAHEKRGSVYSLTKELDAWIQSRRLSLGAPEIKPEAEIPPAIRSDRGAKPARRARLWLALAPFFASACWLLPGSSSGIAQPLRFSRGSGRSPCCPCGICREIRRRNTWPTASRRPSSGASRTSTACA